MEEEGFALNHSVEKLVSENSLFLFSHSAVKISTLEPKLNVMALFCSVLMSQVSANLLDNLQQYTVPHNLYQGFLQQEVGSRKVDPYRGLYCHRPYLEVVCASSTKESSLASFPAPNLRYESCFYTCLYNNCMYVGDMKVASQYSNTSLLNMQTSYVSLTRVRTVAVV